MEDRPVYVKTRCFETFPFPDASEPQEIIRELAERLDAFRKARLAEHPKLTMTNMYNVLEEVRAGWELSAKSKTVHDQGLITTLLSLHTDLDAAVAAAYGWVAGLPAQDILTRLLALNTLRAQEEKAGLVRYLRPEYQDPKAVQQTGLGISADAPVVLEDDRCRSPASFPSKLRRCGGYCRRRRGPSERWRLQDGLRAFVKTGWRSCSSFWSNSGRRGSWASRRRCLLCER